VKSDSAVPKTTVSPDGPGGSDSGQDDWILKHFKPDYHGTAVELGALDGVYLSNTLKLEQNGWRCLCIEPNPRYRDALICNRKLVQCCACLDIMSASEPCYENELVYQFTQTAIGGEDPWGNCPFPSKVPVLTLDICLRLAGFTSLDVLSLDTDGSEARVLKGFNLAYWKPKFVFVENLFDGESVDPILREAGYGFIQRMGYDSVYGKPGECAP
jgi:FkbM family methyltransferase